jgi:hypothetical protein
MKQMLALLRLLRFRVGCLVTTLKDRLLPDQEQDLSPAEIDERFRISLGCGF